MTTRVIFLCIGNSCRSQMAEGSAEQVLAVFRAVRDEVRRRVGELVAAVQRGEGGTP